MRNRCLVGLGNWNIPHKELNGEGLNQENKRYHNVVHVRAKYHIFKHVCLILYTLYAYPSDNFNVINLITNLSSSFQWKSIVLSYCKKIFKKRKKNPDHLKKIRYVMIFL